MDRISLIICTYMRPKAIIALLNSVAKQDKYPDEIIIVDGSLDDKTKNILSNNRFKNILYFKVDEQNRGLTKQRNFGISKVSKNIDIVSFLDDDTILRKDYFYVLSNSFSDNIVGVGANPYNYYKWKKKKKGIIYSKKKYYHFEGYIYKEGKRNVLRNYLGLQSPYPSSIMPKFSHGRSCGYPKTGNVYKVDLLTGFAFSFKKIITDRIKFSEYFIGYGLYEDADYCIEASKFGQLIINTNLYIDHLVEPLGRPNKYKFGKMILRNGWYVWRKKYPKLKFKNIFKWYTINILLIVLRFTNVFGKEKRMEALSETLGRVSGLVSLIFNKPRIK